MRQLVGNNERADIDRLVAKILRDLGDPEPPLRFDLVRELLRLDFKYYSSTDVTPLQEFAHRLSVAGKRLVEDPRLILDVVRKAKLSGLWIPDGKRIFVDQEQPQAKHRWIEAHEISHSFIPWHSQFLLGDDELTLDPACHETIEAEANFGAGRLIFFGDQFASEARDLAPIFNSIQTLRKRYQNSLQSTFWRFVEDRDPTAAVFGLVSRHPHHASIGVGPNGESVHKVVTTEGFRRRFGHVGPLDLYELIARNANRKKSGPVVSGEDVLIDANGAPSRVNLDGFCNTYHLLTYGICGEPLHKIFV